ncbi:peptidoglycan DD-metalloendopeptidase family protein [Desulfosporosinus sp. OT]|uniref:peptidoglycan DD-metalloendopeptidase family protein n=1 Tax=Desulfosporosinus sp. OT TaxID=913865 RepID=UPI0002239B25|nr:peptidoglycan DD-metalloendopeptidase family protein [Desulfosporosinus sp. OT]EGW40274.1 lysM domain protein [Desulfosporosinus sp. OT]
MKNYNLRKLYTLIRGFLTDLNIRTKAFLMDLKPGSAKFHISWKSPKVIVGTITFILVIGGSTVYLSGTASAAYLVLNGQTVGLVESVETGQHLVDDILTERGQAIGKEVKTHDQIEYKTARVNKSALLGEMSTENKLQKKLTSYVDGYALEIAGTQIAILPNQEDITKLLKTYQEFYTKPSDNNQVTSVEFSESIATKPIEAQPDQVKLPDQVLKELKDGKITTTEYTAQENDSWWLIARKNDMKTKEVLDGNPGMTEDSVIQPGQKIKLVSSSPYLTVLSKGILSSTEIVAFDVITKTDTSLNSGETEVKEKGSDGSKLVTYSYVQKNGEYITKEVIDEKVTKQPVSQVVAKGPSRSPVTVAYKTSRGSGSISGISWPLSGSISSYYGSRGGGFHTGLDISGDTGEPYSAAASGTIVAAGWSGGYGNMILIDHGNGVMTRYGHSSRLLVSVGQHVSKGQTIGLVGSTGNATGPHLHFEIILNGDTTNPLNYLR